MNADQRKRFDAIVKGASMARGMPSYGQVLDDKQIGLVHQYVIKRNHELRQSVVVAKE